MATGAGRSLGWTKPLRGGKKTTLHASNCSIKNSWLFFQVGFTLHVDHYDPILRTPDKLCKPSIYFTFSLI
jgi:hypothetical protein